MNQPMKPIWPMPGADVNAKAQRRWIYVSLGATPVFLVGMLLVRFFPPKSPNTSAEEIGRIYAEHGTQVELGAMILVFGALLYASFGAVRIPWVWRLEAGRFPLLTFFSVFCIAIDCALVTLCFVLFAAIGYRADVTPPEITRALLDLDEFLMIFAVPPIIGGMGAFAAAIFRDDRGTFPRWLAWVNIAAAIFSLGAATIGFSKSGPFAWDGIFGFWFVLIAFGVWESIMGLCLLKAIANEEAAALEHGHAVADEPLAASRN